MSSPYAEAWCVEVLPATLRHSFLKDLEQIAAIAFEELSDAREADLASWRDDESDSDEFRAAELQEISDEVSRMLWDDLARNTPDLDAMRRKLLEPRLAAFLEYEAAGLEQPPDWLPA